jgi:2-polyprenyl-3-methyl-5-hydroxy-6-metoxy-1,4-benzoquinol methylase
MQFCCPKDKSNLIKENDKYLCPVCGAKFFIKNSIPFFVQSDFYWGEIPQKDMNEMLSIMDQEGYEQGLEYLNQKHPGRSNFIFNVTRSDWRFPIDIKPGMKVLDLGCGWGSNSFPLAELGADVYSMDITKERVEFVKKRADFEGINNVTPLVGDVMEAPFSDNAFDLIICNGVFEWIGLGVKHGGPVEVQEKFLKSMNNMLKQNGILYIGIENRWAASYFNKGIDHSGIRYTSLMPRVVANFYSKIKIGKPYLTYTYSYRGYHKIFNKSGFQDVKTYIPFPGYNNPVSLVPYDSFVAMRVFLANTGKFKKIQNKLFKKIVLSRPVLTAYRFFIYSFSFYLKK